MIFAQISFEFSPIDKEIADQALVMYVPFILCDR